MRRPRRTALRGNLAWQISGDADVDVDVDAGNQVVLKIENNAFSPSELLNPSPQLRRVRAKQRTKMPTISGSAA